MSEYIKKTANLVAAVASRNITFKAAKISEVTLAAPNPLFPLPIRSNRSVLRRLSIFREGVKG